MGTLPMAGDNGLRPQAMLNDPAAALFDDTKIHTVEITLDPANTQKLEQTAAMEMWVQGEVTIDGMKVAPIGVRYKGNYTLTFCVQNRCRKSYKLDFAEFKKDNRFLGLKRLNLHVMFNDETYMRDSLAYGVQRDFGVPASRTAHAKVTVNGKPMGLYIMVEAVDGQFARTRFADGKGNVYKEEWPSSTTASPWMKALRTNRDDMPSVDRAVRFSNELKGANDGNFEQIVSKWIDVDTLAKTIALDRALQNWDGPIDAWWCFGGKCKNHNFYWYEEAGRDRLWLLLWDMNDTFKPFLFKQIHMREGLPDFPEPMSKPCSQEIRVLNGSTPAKPSYCDDFLRRVGTILKPKLVAAQKQLVETEFSREKMQARVDRLTKLLEPVVTELEKTQGIQQPAFQLQKWKNDVRNLREGFIPEMVNDLRMRASR
jgi:spore coat protein CotH